MMMPIVLHAGQNPCFCLPLSALQWSEAPTTANKVDRPVKLDDVIFILGQNSGHDLPWEVFLHKRPAAFCICCRTVPTEVDDICRRFHNIKFDIIRPKHLTPYTAIIAWNCVSQMP